MAKGDQRVVHMRFKKRLLPGRYFVSAIVNELVGDVAKPLALHQNVLSFEITGSDLMTGIADLGMSLDFH